MDGHRLYELQKAMPRTRASLTFKAQLGWLKIKKIPIG